MAVLVVLILGAVVFARQVLSFGKGCCRLLQIRCLHGMLAKDSNWAIGDMPTILGLNWIDLEIYEGTHNTIAAVLQSFITILPYLLWAKHSVMVSSLQILFLQMLLLDPSSRC